MRFSIAALERHIGISQNMWRHWKNGIKPRMEDVASIARKLGMSPRWLLLGEGEPLDKEPGQVEAKRAEAQPSTEDLARQLVRNLTTRNPAEVTVDLVDARRGRLEISFTRKPEEGYPAGGDDSVREGRPARVHDPPANDREGDLPSNAAVKP